LSSKTGTQDKDKKYDFLWLFRTYGFLWLFTAFHDVLQLFMVFFHKRDMKSELLSAHVFVWYQLTLTLMNWSTKVFHASLQDGHFRSFMASTFSAGTSILQWGHLADE
jgi:hypothetical protein